MVIRKMRPKRTNAERGLEWILENPNEQQEFSSSVSDAQRFAEFPPPGPFLPPFPYQSLPPGTLNQNASSSTNMFSPSSNLLLDNHFPPFEPQTVDFSPAPFIEHQSTQSSSNRSNFEELGSDLLFGLSARLPIVQDGQSPHSVTSDTPASQGSRSDPNGQTKSRVSESKNQKEDSDGDSETCKVTWFRPMGSTSIAPGLQRLTLRLKRERRHPVLAVDSPGSSHHEHDDLFDEKGQPSRAVLSHLLDVRSLCLLSVKTSLNNSCLCSLALF
jgi:hypothetical protein